jgi:hypothetical protein
MPPTGAPGAPSVCALPPPELAAFCADHGYGCRLELAGSALRPPERSVPLTDWERALRLRRGEGFRVLPQEPPLPRAGARGTAPPQARRGGWPGAGAEAEAEAEGQVLPRAGTEFSREQLAAAAAALEALLPPPPPPPPQRVEEGPAC